MGLVCSSNNNNNENHPISYSELDKIIFIEHQYMRDIIQQKDIEPYYPQLNFTELEKEKGDKVKKRHFFKWYQMSYEKNTNIFSTLPIDSLFGKVSNQSEQSITSGSENKIESINNKKEIITPKTEVEISGSEIGIRDYNMNNPAHFESRVIKAPPLAFRWIGWLVLSGIPEKRIATPYHNLQTYPLAIEIENQIQKDLTRTLESNHLMIKEIKECMYRILKALALLDNEMSYVQGINFICGFLLVISNQNELDTFYFLMSLFSQTYSIKFGMRDFYTENFPLIYVFYSIFERNLKRLFPKVAEHINKISLPHLAWISPWMQMIYVNVFPNEVVLRIWDCFFVYGLSFLISFGFSIVEVVQDDLLQLTDLCEIGEYFKLLNPTIHSNFKDKNKIIKYDIELMILRATTRYAISSDEITNEILNMYPKLNRKTKYRYLEIQPYKSVDISNKDNIVTNGENIIENKKVDEVKQEDVQTKKEEIEIKKEDCQNLKNFEEEKIKEQDKDSIKSDEFEVEDELIDEDKDNHVKAINLVGITMKKYGHQLQKDKNSNSEH